MTITKEPVLITAEELAQMLRISTRTLWRQLSAGQLVEPVRIGGSTRWSREKVLQWIENGCQSSDGRDN